MRNRTDSVAELIGGDLISLLLGGYILENLPDLSWRRKEFLCRFASRDGSKQRVARVTLSR